MDIKGICFKLGGFLAGLACAAGVQAAEPVPIEDIKIFERQFTECIMSSVKNDCIVSLFKKHAFSAVISADVISADIDALNSIVRKDLEETGVYKVYVSRVSKPVEVEIFDDKFYIIEKKDGDVLLFRILFRKRLGKCYIFHFEITNNNKKVSKLLGLSWDE
ncbi:MAG: hypothetical protein LBU76_07755 [Azoarcus sp.]|jgi:hypothetical protein|nr:hypothetical protein [Azoarcus sp.]